MDDNKMNIEIKQDIVNLAGYEYGVQIYDEQLKDRLDFTRPFVIELPERIEIIASSFIQGMFDGIIKIVGLRCALDNLQITCGQRDVTDYVKERL